MKIIGHRGAAGLALENTLQSISAAVEAGVDAIEFDVRLTADDKLVLIHDKHTGRIGAEVKKVQKQSLSDLRTVMLHNGQNPANLKEAIAVAADTPLVIEGKESGWAIPLAKLLKNDPCRKTCSVISYNLKELYSFKLLMPNVQTYALEHTKPFEVIQSARVLGFNGIDINFWLLNPLTYWMVRRRKLDLIVYTVNSPLLARFLRVLYPRVSITTDYPDRLQFLRTPPVASAGTKARPS